MNKPLTEAMQVLNNALKEDPEYRMSWQANIAMAFKDSHHFNCGTHSTHYIANEAANNFLNTLSGDNRKLKNPPEDL